MKTQKKSWKKPALIVIGRGTPEEKVLAGCKSGVGVGPNMKDPGCTDTYDCHQSRNS